MSLLLPVAAAACGLLLGASALGAFAAWQVRRLWSEAGRRRQENDLQGAAVREIERRIEALAARIEEARAVPVPQAPPMGRGGLNLSRRSQALRLHRRGEPPARIAAELAIPQQEVELLLKVHEIVMSTVN